MTKTKTITNTTDYGRTATDGERRIIARLLTAAFQNSYSVSVFDGEVWTVKSTTKRHKVLEALATTGEDALRFRDPDGNVVGHVYLVWGNDPSGEELIYDYTNNVSIGQLVRATI